jgi:hypothetical protein
MLGGLRVAADVNTDDAEVTVIKKRYGYYYKGQKFIETSAGRKIYARVELSCQCTRILIFLYAYSAVFLVRVVSRR